MAPPTKKKKKKATAMLRAEPAAVAAGAELESDTALWGQLVLLCSNCSGQQHGGAAPDEVEKMPSWDTWKLRGWLKDELSRKALWGKVRVVTAGCLGICNPGTITVVLGSEAGGVAAPRCLLVDPERDHDALLRTIEASIPV